MTNKDNIGITDLPITKSGEDTLGAITYIDGLTKFISTCNTPMTIAIQGDWGTGKTSFINLVNNKLKNADDDKKKDKIQTITFNTWKYSQFNQKQNLSISFLSYIVSQIAGKPLNTIVKEISDKVEDKVEDQPEGIETFNKNLGALSRNFFLDLVGQVLPRTVGNDTVINLIDQQNQFARSTQLDSAAAIEELKGSFKKAVEESLEYSNTDRIVIFIDDLDRLDPVIAVDLLEIIKLFLDVRHCVFVLAVDYNVVSKGVKLKQGDLDMDDEKAHSFFDKMIQVPFRIPKEFYNFENFLNKNLPSISNLSDLQAIIQYSVGNNPRSVKRLLNSYHLISNIIFDGNENIKMNDKQHGLLLSILCMQLAHEPLYLYFCAKLDNFKLLKASDKEQMMSILTTADINTSKDSARKHFLFLSELSTYIFDGDINNSSQNDDALEIKLEEFSMMLSYSTITSEKIKEEDINIKEINLSKITEVDQKKYKINTIRCKDMTFSANTIVRRVFEIYQHVFNENLNYKYKLKDYKELPDMKKAGIEPRLILPMLREWIKNPDIKKWIEFNAPEFLEIDKYATDLDKRKIPGTECEIIINYPALKTLQNLFYILTFLNDGMIDKITVVLEEK